MPAAARSVPRPNARRDRASDRRIRAAVLMERARCAQIIAHGVKLGLVEQAGVLAFDTQLTVAAARRALDDAAIAERAGAARRRREDFSNLIATAQRAYAHARGEL